MTYKTYEPSSMEKFFAEGNFLIQVSLILAAIFYTGFVSELASPFNTIATIVGLIGIGSMSVLCRAYASRYSIYYKYLNEDMDAVAHNQASKSHLPIPKLSKFLIRSTLSFIIFLIVAAILLSIGIALIPNSLNLIMPMTQNNEALAIAISMVVIMPLFIIILGLVIGTYVFAPVIVDQSIYKNDLIRAHLYEEGENPLALGKIGKGLWSLIKATLGFGSLIGIMLAVRIGMDWMDATDQPLYMICGVSLIVVALSFGFMWIMSKRSAQRQTDEYMDKVENELIKLHGEDSDDVRNFRDERNAYNAMSKEEKKALAEEAEPEVASMMGQIYKGMPLLFVGGMILATVGSIALTFGAVQFGLQGEAIELFGKGSFAVFLLLLAIAFFWRIKNMTYELPEELHQMGEAADNADYQEAARLALLVEDKIALTEFGHLLTLMHLQVGDLDKAEQIARESIRQLMFQDEEHRMKPFLALSLTALGATLIEAKRYDEAEDTFIQALSQDSKNPWTLSNLSEVYCLKRKGDKALEYAERAINANQKKSKTEQVSGSTHLMFKAWALTLLGQYDDTVPLMREAFERAGNTKSLLAALHYYSGHIALVRGKITTAKVAFQRSIDTQAQGITAMQAQKMLDY